MASPDLRRAPLYRAGLRPLLLLGADRELLMSSGLLAFLLPYSTQRLDMVAIGLAFWFLALFILRQIAKADPHSRPIFLKRLKYRDHYPARSSPYCKGLDSTSRPPL